MIIFKIKKVHILLRLIILLILLNALFYFVGMVKDTVGLENLYLNIFFFFLIIMTAYSPAYYLIIDNKQNIIILKYRFLYFIEKQKMFSFKDFEYRCEYGAPFISFGGYKISFYFNKSNSVTLSVIFGWKKKSLMEIKEILNGIKPPKPRLLDRNEKS